MNDPKYFTGPIINTASGERIPQDEPCFLLRARDYAALPVLEFYVEIHNDWPKGKEQAEAVKRRIEEFYAFKETHPERMKQADTDLDNQGTYPVPRTERTEETSERIGRIAAQILAAPDTEMIEERMPYYELLRLSKSLAGSVLTQRPDRG